VLHRLLNEPPRSLCKVNGRAVPLRVLRALGSVLVDVNGQGAAQQLGDSAACVQLLDARAGTAQLAAQFGASLVWARTAEGEAARARAAAPSSQEEADAMQALVDDVAEAEPEAGEDVALKRQLKVLDASRAALDSCAMASQALDIGASDALRTAARELKSVALRLEQHSGGAAAASGRPSDSGDDDDDDEGADVASALASVDQALGLVRSATEVAANASAACSDAARALQSSPGLRDEVSARLRVLERLCRKHSARSVDELLAAAATARDALGNTDGAAEKAAAMADAAAAAVRDMARLGLQLSLARREAARQLQGHVEQSLAQLCMGGARLRVALEWHDIAVTAGEEEDDEDGHGAGGSSSHAIAVPGADALGFDAQCLYEPTPTGFDRASLLLATGPGEPFRPLSAVASGGERARVMLALKAVAAAAAGPAVSLFDEVDAGVGGSAGGAVGAALRRLSLGTPEANPGGALQRQVLCVTHLPQVAAHAHVHLAVSKVLAADGRAVSVTAELHSRTERAAELGTLLGLTPDAGEQLLAMTEAREPAPLS
jgi:DNA repair protein RecN (Recombination protein N)